MPKFLLAWLLGLAANAIALALCWALLPGFSLNLTGFILAVVIFGILSVFFTWLVFRLLRGQGAPVVAFTGLISTFLALLLTSLLTPGLSIDGIGTWVIATLIIWVLSVFIWVIPGPWRTVKRERDRKDST